MSVVPPPQQYNQEDDEILFDMLKDEFVFFYALTVTVMDICKHMTDIRTGDAEDEHNG